jgi:phosphoglycolate phosphatase
MRPLVVFDLDGTLVDSRQDLADSTNAMLGSLGAPPLPRDRVVKMIGEGARILVQKALEASHLPSEDKPLHEALGLFHECYRARLLATTRPYPGVSAMLEEMSSLASLAMLTNKPLSPSLRLVEAFGWRGHFMRVIGGDGDMPRKPDPKGLRRLMAEANAGPESTLLVGDSMIDVETARNAGVTVCVAAYGMGTVRGDLQLRGDERIAETGHDVGRVIREWRAHC